MVNDFQKQLEVAKYASDSGDQFKASIIYRSIIEANPNVVIAWIELARLSLQIGEGDVAIDYLLKAIEHNPDSAVCQISIGKIYFHRADLEKSEQHIRSAMKISPQEISFIQALVDVLVASRQFETAIAEINIGKKLVGDNPQFLLVEAKVWNQIGETKTAIDILDNIAAEAENDPKLLVDVGRVYTETGCEDKAIEAFLAATDLAPDDPSAKYQLAMVYQTENMTLHKAFEVMDQAVSLDPNLHNDYLRGCWYMRCGDYQNAIRSFEAAVDKSVAFEPLFQLGRANYYAGNREKSIEVVSRVLAQCEMNIENQNGDVEELQAAKVRFQCLLNLIGGTQSAKEQIEINPAKKALKFDDPYFSDTPNKLDALRAKMNKRDLAILCHGHSIENLEARIEELADLDFEIWIVNRFRVLEQSITKKIGRLADGIVLSHPRAAQQVSDHILDYLGRENPGQLITSAWVLDLAGEALPSRKILEKQYGNSLIYFSASPFWPANTDFPLRLPSGNTLSIALGVAAAIAPRRIFLFGADGGVVQGKSNFSHFGGGSEDFRAKTDGDMKGILENILLTDATQFEELVEVGMLAVRQLFNQPEFPVYNVSPDSAYNPFPKISYDEAIAMMRDQ